MITIKGEGLQDGLYNIKNGKIFKYRAKGGTVRTYEMGEVVTCKECKHLYKDGECPLRTWFTHTEDDYCSYGERREDAPTIEPPWIPIKYHKITDEEREENNYPDDWVYFLDCEMPEDGQEILVTTKNGYVEKDVCFIDDGYGLDSGWDWREDVVAWMPRPEPYRKEEDDDE